MRPDDPRHGTTAGFHQGCREACCNAARARYEKEGRLLRSQGRGRAVDPIGAQRRIRALMRMGWTSTDIAQAAGWPARNYVLRILSGQKGKPARYISRETHEAIVAVYDRLSMRLPEPSPCRARTRTLAERRGYPSPLAWDDDALDDPKARPEGVFTVAWEAAGYDEARVQRRINGDRSIRLHRGESVEVVRRMLADGLSQNEIRRRTGLKPDRYMAEIRASRRDEQEAAA